MNTRTMASAQHKHQIVKRLLLLRIQPAVLDANGGGNVQSRHCLLHRCHARSEAHAFQPRRYRDVPLQVFAANFGLPGILLHGRQRAQRRDVSRCR